MGTLHMCKMKKLTLLVFLIFVKSETVKSKLSKAMKTFHDASEEDNTVMKERTTIPYQKLRNILSEESPRICTESRDYIYRSNLTSHSNKYSYNSKFWLSSTKTWSIALVDYSPFTERVAGVNSMLQKSEIVILHDSQEHRYFDIPSDFKLLQSEGSPTAHDTCGTGPESEAHTVTGYRRFSKWNGHKTFTDCSEPVLYKRYNEEWGLGTAVHIKKERTICTTMIQGAKDNGLFDKVVQVYKEKFEDVDSCYYHHNMNNAPYCTHLRLLLPAALLSTGDVIELGSGECSTQLLHNIMQDKVERGEARSRLVTVDTDQDWLVRYTHLHSPHHAFILVPELWTFRPYKKTSKYYHDLPYYQH